MSNHDRALHAVDGILHTAMVPQCSTLSVLVLGGSGPDNALLRALIAGAEGMRALASGAPSNHARQSVCEPPDVILLDVGKAGDEADACVARASSAWKPAPVLVVFDGSDSERMRQLIRAGARGFVGRNDAISVLVKAIRKVAEGELWLDRASFTKLIDEISVEGWLSKPDVAKIASLTARERAVIDLVSQGFSNKAISKRLAISDSTVRHHLSSIFATLGVTDRLGLAVFALRHRP